MDAGCSATLTFTAQVQADAVDWHSTIALVPGGEEEICLRDGGQILVQTITDGYGEPVREDLWGGEFRASAAV